MARTLARSSIGHNLHCGRRRRSQALRSEDEEGEYCHHMHIRSEGGRPSQYHTHRGVQQR